MPPLTLSALRRHAIARSLFDPTTLAQALQRLGFVQADPLRAPARAQDLTLRHRVRDYRAGDLEHHYPALAIEEDFLVNYGFLSPDVQALMHPRQPRMVWSAERWRQAESVLEFVRARGEVHPRDVAEAFDHGRVTTGFGSASRASTALLDGMHYRGLLRVARREAGTRLYAARPATPPPADPEAAFDALVDLVVAKYAPLPGVTLGQLLSHLVHGVPQWRHLRAATLQRARARLPSAEVDGLRWFWPEGEEPSSHDHQPREAVALLAPFDPVVWDRTRFERFWGWAYRFEAYAPAARRLRGHYALPLLWREQVIGWANLKVEAGRLQPDIGHVAQAPRDAAYSQALDEELQRISCFLGLD
ncbi:MAG: winged helix DNA-binding domain-containing protein [Sphaerotilus natans subsp. sulfidivorans]|uniref:DNA glycosylase AlkZ-like family protein n=1 Tax=Sphaerotilus sulfidivorans TaxID=639200 RepID=UPI002357ACC7|nr:crosslink repair DNA glycosylase YcaQ family protein [Sphaerotilus sulfidivorans]MCK6403713.1 winged helix DNA-binding domain-containing protein [Sphaerotilus sulfidivorans]